MSTGRTESPRRESTYEESRSHAPGWQTSTPLMLGVDGSGEEIPDQFVREPLTADTPAPARGPAAVQQRGRPMAGSWSNATRSPKTTALVPISARGPKERNARFGCDAGWSRPRAGTG